MATDSEKAVVSITTRYIQTCEMENLSAANTLEFSVWVAAFATAGLGLLLTQGNALVSGSWVSGSWSGKVVGGWALLLAQIMLAFALVVAARIRWLVNARHYHEFLYIALLGAQEARLHCNPIVEPRENLVADICNGAFLPADSKKTFDESKDRSSVLDRKCGFWLNAQLLAVAAGYGVTIVLGFRVP